MEETSCGITLLLLNLHGGEKNIEVARGAKGFDGCYCYLLGWEFGMQIDWSKGRLSCAGCRSAADAAPMHLV